MPLPAAAQMYSNCLAVDLRKTTRQAIAFMPIVALAFLAAFPVVRLVFFIIQLFICTKPQLMQFNGENTCACLFFCLSLSCPP